MTTLPFDMMIEILLKLPAKSLLRFKCVCKFWYFLISDPFFANLHLDKSLATDINLHIVMSTFMLFESKYDFHDEPLQLTCPVLYKADFDTLGNPIELNHPFKNCDTGMWPVGSCHGLLCLEIDFRCHLILYNPTTQTHKLLPFVPIIEPFSNNRVHLRFGYDSVSMDYKCVRVLQYLDIETKLLYSEVMVYSLRANCWRKGSDVPYYFDARRGRNGVVLHEIVHWIGKDDVHVAQPILGFNLRDETFSSLSLPVFSTEEFSRPHVGVLDDCLFLSVNYTFLSDIWVMKEYGITKSWMKILTFGKKPYVDVERFISYSEKEKRLFIVMSLWKTAYLDLETLEITEVKLHNSTRCLDGYVCVENLVMLYDTDDAPVQEERQCRRKPRKRSTRRNRRENR